MHDSVCMLRPVVAPLPSYPVGSCHLHYHLGGSSAEVAAVAAHHHGAALSVPQVDGGQHALDVVLQIVLLPLEHRRLPPQPAGTGPLVVEGGGLDRHHRDRARLHPPRRDPTGGRRSNNLEMVLKLASGPQSKSRWTQRWTLSACKVKFDLSCRGGER